MSSVMTSEVTQRVAMTLQLEFDTVLNGLKETGWEMAKNGEGITVNDLKKLGPLAKQWMGALFINNTELTEKLMADWQTLMSAVQQKESGGAAAGALVVMLSALAGQSAANFAMALVAITAAVVHTRSNKATLKIKDEYGGQTADPFLHIAWYVLNAMENCEEGGAAQMLLPRERAIVDPTTGELLTPNAIYEPLRQLIPAQLAGLSYSINGRIFFVLMNREGMALKLFNTIRQMMVYNHSVYGICKAVDEGFIVNQATYLIDLATHRTMFPTDKGSPRMYAFMQDYYRSMIAFRNNVAGGMRLTFGDNRVHLKGFLKIFRESPQAHAAIKALSAPDLDKAMGFADAEGHALYDNIPCQKVPNTDPPKLEWVGLQLSLPPKGKAEFAKSDQEEPRTAGFDTRKVVEVKTSYNYDAAVAAGVPEGRSVRQEGDVDAVKDIKLMRTTFLLESLGVDMEDKNAAAKVLQNYQTLLDRGGSPEKAQAALKAAIAKKKARAAVAEAAAGDVGDLSELELGA